MANTTENSEVGLLYKVRKTVLTTLKDRGYEVPLGTTKMSLDDFRMVYEQNRHHLYFPDMEPVSLKEEYRKGGGVLVYFESSNKFDKKIFLARMAQLNKEYPKLDKLFFVLKTYGDVKVRKLNIHIHSELSKYPNVEVLENIYPFDFMKNSLVPVCYLLSDEEKEAVFDFLDTPINNFPKFEVSDPVPVRFGAKIGDMIYIKRYGGLELSYRVVVKTGSS
jgi:DNA-directed RNA polymerase subunit H (RpoH/RPB5)